MVGHVALQLPCVTASCSRCCRDTTMPLTREEAAKIARRTGKDVSAFTWENDQGVLTLLNEASTRACTFLLTDSAEADAPGLCSIYEFRPKGCRMYPVVLNDDDRAVVDEECPHPDGFPPPSEDDAMVLLNLEERMLRGG